MFLAGKTDIVSFLWQLQKNLSQERIFLVFTNDLENDKRISNDMFPSVCSWLHFLQQLNKVLVSRQ